MKILNFKSIEEWNRFISYSTYIVLAVYFLVVLVGEVSQITFLIGYICVSFPIFIAIITVINRKLLIKQEGKKYFRLYMLFLFVLFISMLLVSNLLLWN